MDENYWQAINTLAQSVQAGAGMISAADLSSKNRDFYEKQYAIQRKYNTQERIAAQNYNTSERQAVQSWNEMMWERQNDYSTPSAQMQRMMAAGINPNNAALAIGSQGAASVNGVSPASSPSASVSAPGMPQQFNPAQAYAEMYNSYTMAQEQRSQARLNEAVAKKTEEESTGIVIDNQYKPFEKQANIDLALQRIDLMQKQGNLSDEQATNLRELLPLLKGKTLGEQQKLFADAAFIASKRQNLVAEKQLLLQQIETEKHKRKQLDAAAYEAYMAGNEHKSAIDLNGVKMSLEAAETRLKVIDGNLKKSDNVWRNLLRTRGIDPDSHGAGRLIDTSIEGFKTMVDDFRSLINMDDLQLNSYSWDDLEISEDLKKLLE